MTDKKKGIVWLPCKFILYLASLIYWAAIFIRVVLYKFGIFRSEDVPIKVVSVGNLTLGGTGKTPFVIRLARILKDEIRKSPSVLIRGYGWDEQAMLKKDLPDIPIFVDEDRAKSAHRAIALYGCDIAVLDDGFQHWELERDLDIVLIDSRNPFGNNHLFPRGILREPKESILRADIVVFTKMNKKLCDIEQVKEEMLGMNSELVFMEAIHKPTEICDTKTKKAFGLDWLAKKRVMLLSSIGDPGYFEETVRDLKADVVEHIIFNDHHNYTEADSEHIIKRCNERSFDIIVTTEKDAVKINRLHLTFANYTVFTLMVEMEITSGKEILIDRLHSLYTDKASQ